MKTKHLILIITLILLLAACAPSAEPPAFDIRGAWTYTLNDAQGNFYDQGTITFSGSATEGSYTLVNYYEIEYEGTYQVEADQVNLSGDVEMLGHFTNTDHLQGDWSDTQTGDKGTWTAERN